MRNVVLFICAIIAGLTWFSAPSDACQVSSLIRPSLLPDRPNGDFKIVAKVEVVELLKPIRPSGYGDSSFYAKARVIESESGLSSNSVVQIAVSASSCDVPVSLGQIGYIGSNNLTIINGVVSLDVTAPR